MSRTFQRRTGLSLVRFLENFLTWFNRETPAVASWTYAEAPWSYQPPPQIQHVWQFKPGATLCRSRTSVVDQHGAASSQQVASSRITDMEDIGGHGVLFEAFTQSAFIDQRESMLDEALDESFPASDPVSSYRFD
jgi:hypothetical protein